MLRIIAGTHKSRKFNRVNQKSTRETSDAVREAVFNMLGSQIDGIVLDLFAGSGAYGLEALSRGASTAFFVDVNPVAYQTIISNIKLLSFDNQSHTYLCDYQSFFSKLPDHHLFDYIFIDPPYAFASYDTLLLRLSMFLNESGIIIVESEKNTIFNKDLEHLTLFKEKVYGIKKITMFIKK